MESEAMNDIAFRLLELEQRFEAYCTLYEEELRDIEAKLRELREDALRIRQGSKPEDRSIERSCLPAPEW
jgi:hypothetical protein